MESTSGQKEELFLDVDVDFRSLTAVTAREVIRKNK